MKQQYNTTTSRWYLCECERKSCREEFFMRVIDYDKAQLGDVRLVVPSHKPTGVKVIARWSGVVMIPRKEKA